MERNTLSLSVKNSVKKTIVDGKKQYVKSKRIVNGKVLEVVNFDKNEVLENMLNESKPNGKKIDVAIMQAVNNRSFYLCECALKLGYSSIDTQPFTKTIYVFKSLQDRDNYIKEMGDENKYFKVTQKEAYKIVGLNKKDAQPMVYRHPYNTNLMALANIKECWGLQSIPLKEYDESTKGKMATL